MPKSKVSDETQAEALKIARGIQKPGQTKEQTKLIAQGIEKGIAEYKKQQKAKARERDKLRKKDIKTRDRAEEEVPTSATPRVAVSALHWLPWVGMILTWGYFVGWPLLTK